MDRMYCNRHGEDVAYKQTWRGCPVTDMERMSLTNRHGEDVAYKQTWRGCPVTDMERMYCNRHGEDVL